MGPLDPRLVRRARATRIFLAGGLVVGCLTALLTLGQARVLADTISSVFAGAGTGGLGVAIGVLAAIFAGRGLLAWATQWFGQRAAAAVKSQLRREIMTARVARPLDSPTSTGALITLVTKGLDALDNYYSRYLPQLLLAATVPLIVVLAVLSADVTSAIILAVTLPLIPVFMMLVGWTTEARTKRRWATQTRLAHHFADLVAGLPTLQVFGRARAQLEGLRRSEAAHRTETMGTLRISFLSALVLELLATLSVAIVAVTVGFRVVYGDLDLATALFVLIVAPEAYLPVRQVGVHFHDSADGVAAANAAFALIDDPTTPHVAADAATRDAILSVREVSHTYAGAKTVALQSTSFDVLPGELVALAGPSGAGKSTLLNVVVGFIAPSAGTVERRGAAAWVGQEPGLVNGTVADNVRLGHPDATDAAVRDALDRAGASSLALDKPVGDDAEGVSAGERRRIAVARALLHVSLTDAALLVLDEPTAGLDADTEAGLLSALRALGVAVLVVSHRQAVLAEADRVVRLEAPAAATSQAVAGSALGQAAPAERKPTPPAARPDGLGQPGQFADLPGDDGPLLRRVLGAVPGAQRRLGVAVLLSFLATGASVALMAVSGWLLSRAAEQPPVMYLLPAATMVRAFGVSRGGFRYLERLASHGVALRLQSALRLETYSRLARTTLLGSRRGDLLSRVIADVEAIQDLVVRVWIPFGSSVLVILATCGALAVFSPASAAVLLLSAVLAGLLVPWLARRASRRSDSGLITLRGELAGSVHEIAHAAPDLVAYAAADDYLGRLAAVDARLRRHEARSSWVRGVAEGFQLLAAGLAVVGALWFGGHQVAAGTLAPVMLAVLALTPLALHESLGALAHAAQTATRARAALRRVEEVLDAPPVGSGDREWTQADRAAVSRPSLTLTGLDAGWPGEAPVVTGLDLSVLPGEKVALVGPSGIGKTTVAATILGLIEPKGGALDLEGRPGYLAQDAHIFDTTVAENVKIGNRDASDAEVAVALSRAGLGWLEPSRLVGEDGSALSGGEARRLALARIFAGDYQVLVLDEPTEHLDSATATALVDDIWETSSETPVLVITHDPALVARCDRAIALA